MEWSTCLALIIARRLKANFSFSEILNRYCSSSPFFQKQMYSTDS